MSVNSASPMKPTSLALQIDRAITAVCQQNLQNGHAELCTYHQLALHLNNGFDAKGIGKLLRQLHPQVVNWWRVVGQGGLLETEPAKFRLEQYQELQKHGQQFNGPNVLL